MLQGYIHLWVIFLHEWIARTGCWSPLRALQFMGYGCHGKITLTMDLDIKKGVNVVHLTP